MIEFVVGVKPDAKAESGSRRLEQKGEGASKNATNPWQMKEREKSGETKKNQAKCLRQQVAFTICGAWRQRLPG